ncbi:MAG: MFS transporter [Pseudomonadales bacterium]|nr:MFS transporter [Gammaproteobacteria bacterium]MBP6051890.1 MFS transporter [Pseudomonadales bacterium]MBK6581890.1 MFS transporter [Gammaproteobacteria bacterium]MBK7520725.1 MFS transporter [Gammaproteobacteria bacterium]MBK8308291.1 MFS transporter [Gammaproteobacteria bacterium]
MRRARASNRLRDMVPYAGVFAHGMGQSIVMAILPSLGREIGLQEVAIGAIISLSSLVFFISSRMWGRLSDRSGRKQVILIGLWGYTIGTLVFAVLFGLGMAGVLGGTLLYGLIVGTRMIQSTMMSGTAPGTAAYIADITTPETRAAGMGRLSASSNVGSILGPAVAGTLAALSLLLPLVFAALATAAAALLVQRLLNDRAALPPMAHHSGKLHMRDRRILPYLALSLAVFTGFSIVQQTLAFRIQDTLVLDTRATAQTYGYTMMVSATASLFAQVALVQQLKFAPMILLRIGLPLLLCAFAGLIWSATLPAFFIAMAMMGLGMGLCGPGFSAATSLAVSAREQGAAAGIVTAIPALGFILGPIAGTALYQLDPHYPYVLTTLIMIPTSVLVFRVHQHLHTD